MIFTKRLTNTNSTVLKNASKFDLCPDHGLLVLTYRQALSDFTIIGSRNEPFNIKQFTSFSGTRGDCDSSLFKISGMTLQNWTGSTQGSYLANIDCAKASGGCTDITMENVNVTDVDTGLPMTVVRCSDVSATHGFSC